MQMERECPVSEESQVIEPYRYRKAAAANHAFHDSSEIDFDYEFDAPKYFDFLSSESISEVEDAEEWFRFAGTYPPSPYILKVKWRMSELSDLRTSASECTDSESVDSTVYTTDASMASESSNSSHNLLQKSRVGSLTMSSLSRRSNLMKPTLSYLAKHDQPIPLRSSSGSLGSKYSKPRGSLSKSREIGAATNRQKLETGYPNKARFSSLSSSSTKSSLTIPKGPLLETALRAQRRSCGRSSYSVDGKTKA